MQALSRRCPILPRGYLTDSKGGQVLLSNLDRGNRLAEGVMRRNASADHATNPLLHRPCYYTKAEALQINERSRELCSAAAKISLRAKQLVEASRELERMGTELLSEVKAADSKRHDSAHSG